jgi:hypothetical protein
LRQASAQRASTSAWLACCAQIFAHASHTSAHARHVDTCSDEPRAMNAAAVLQISAQSMQSSAQSTISGCAWWIQKDAHELHAFAQSMHAAMHAWSALSLIRPPFLAVTVSWCMTQLLAQPLGEEARQA